MLWFDTRRIATTETPLCYGTGILVAQALNVDYYSYSPRYTKEIA
jgi:hypothetical protein